MSADQAYEYENQIGQNSDIPTGADNDPDYTSRTGQKDAPIPVQRDGDSIESAVNPATEDSDEQLGTSIAYFVSCSDNQGSTFRLKARSTAGQLALSYLSPHSYP